MEDGLFKWRDIPCSYMEWVNLIKLFLPKLIYKFNTISFKIPVRYLEGLDKNILKIYGRIKIHE